MEYTQGYQLLSQLQKDYNIPKNELIKILKQFNINDTIFKQVGQNNKKRKENKYSYKKYTTNNLLNSDILYSDKCCLISNYIKKRDRKKQPSLISTHNKIVIIKKKKEKYKKINLVGNLYMPEKTKKNDKNIYFVNEPYNPYDINAIRVESRRKNKIKKLGYIPKYMQEEFNKIRNNLKIIGITKKKNPNNLNYPYYHIITKISC